MMSLAYPLVIYKEENKPLPDLKDVVNWIFR